MVNDITATSTIVNAIPMGGYKMLCIKPKSGYIAADYLDLSPYFISIEGAFGVKSGAVNFVTWSGTTLTITTAADTMVVVIGTI